MRRAGGLATKGSGGSVNRTFDPRAPRTQGDVKQKKVWPTERKLIEQKRVCTVWIAVTLHLGLCRRASALVTELFIYFFFSRRMVCGATISFTVFCLSVCLWPVTEIDELWQMSRREVVGRGRNLAA